jgi:hypothetical protein
MYLYDCRHNHIYEIFQISPLFAHVVTRSAVVYECEIGYNAFPELKLVFSIFNMIVYQQQIDTDFI